MIEVISLPVLTIAVRSMVWCLNVGAWVGAWVEWNSVSGGCFLCVKILWKVDLNQRSACFFGVSQLNYNSCQK